MTIEDRIRKSIIPRLFIGLHVFLYRLTGGAIGGRFANNSPVLLLTTTGRKSGKQRTTPVLYLTEGDYLVIVASSGGSDTNPAWWLNLESNPRALVQVGRQVMRVTAVKANQEERERLWPLLVTMFPGFANYQKRTAREIPVVLLKSVEMVGSK
ncbi:MAG: nitroreductase family deazaflavin-dependent oxidoreductase [Chloroflexi bacterium]|nr:nitroreductase family deazaflavin-dependent oxidoreductase [Chloroflexota bacterium]